MAQRDHDRRNETGQSRSPTTPPRRNAGSPVLELQRAIGNRSTNQVLARKKGSDRGTFENSVRIGKLGPLEIAESNIASWTGKQDADDLVATTVKGKHSAELKRMSESKERIDTIEVQAITGENSWVIVTFKNARIRGYAADDSGKTESWKATDFDAVNIKRTSIGKPRP
jgi:hypothetical protein